jgi:hypothetical protein
MSWTSKYHKNRLKLAKKIAGYSERFYETFNSKLIKDIEGICFLKQSTG